MTNLTAEDHLINILKLLLQHGHDEDIIYSIWVYISYHKLIDAGDFNDLMELEINESALCSTQIKHTQGASEYKYVLCESQLLEE